MDEGRAIAAIKNARRSGGGRIFSGWLPQADGSHVTII